MYVASSKNWFAKSSAGANKLRKWELLRSDESTARSSLGKILVFLASRSEVNARGFSEAQPRLHLRLDGGSRLAAAAWVTPRPSVVIRRHRLMKVALDDLVERQMLTPVVLHDTRQKGLTHNPVLLCGISIHVSVQRSSCHFPSVFR